VPTYSYACTECDNRFDAVQAFTEDALTTCPQCSGRLRKLFNSVGVVFKGSGFYRTDSREASKSAVASDSGSSAGSSGSDKSGSDKSGSDKSGTDKSGTDKSGSDKSGSDKSGSEKKSSDKPSSGSAAPSSSAAAPASN
jgi:putative FmdB family regulatory protein